MDILLWILVVLAVLIALSLGWLCLVGLVVRRFNNEGEGPL